MRRALLALLVTLAAAPVHARDALSTLDGCLRGLDAGLDAGYEKIAARCPELAAALVQSPWAAWLPRDWDRAGNNLSAGGLRELRDLIEAQSRLRAGALPQPAHLAAVLAALAPPPRAARSWWESVKGWLREMLSVRESDARPGWLARVLDALKSRAALVKTVSLAALALVALLAGTMVLSELRAAGLLPSRLRRAGTGGAALSASAQSGWAHIEAASPTEQPRLMLELIAARLAALGRLPPARALTVRELLRVALLADAGERERLAELGEACERLRFSGRELKPQTLAAALARGRELLDGLTAVRA